MKDELDKQLVAKYPKIFKNRYGNMQETCMCWGFECGDGWYNIIDMLCANIQNHIDQSRNKRARALRKNRALKRALLGDTSWLTYFYMKHYWKEDPDAEIPEWVYKNIKEDIKEIKFADVGSDVVKQVVAVQVKEKFGGLRFYIDGGDDIVYAMIGMAESMSVVTCETCGSPGRQRSGGWIRTLCDKHEEEYKERNSIYTEEEL